MNPRRLRPFLFGLLFLFIAAAIVFPLTGANPFQTSAGAQTVSPRTRPLPNYDAFAAARGRDGSAARSAAPADPAPQIEAGRPVQYEPRLGVPTFLWAPRQAAGNSMAARGPQQSAGGAVSAAREHLGEYASLYRLSDADVAGAKVVGVHDTGRGAIIVKLKQEVGGVEVFRDEINVVMNRDLQLVALSGYLTGEEAGAGLSAQEFQLRPAEALSKALEDLTGTALKPSAFRVTSPEAAPGEAANPYTLYAADGGASHDFRFAEEPSRIKKVMFHLPEGYVPAYYVEAFVLVPSQDATTITLSGEPVMTELAFSYVISAVDGQLLFRNNLIDEDGEFTYRVWADPETKVPYDTPAGNGPHPKVVPLPDGAQAPFVPQSEVALRNFPFSQNDPWLAPGATETNGNNVDAFVNLFSPDGIGTPTTTTPTDVPNGDHRAFTSGPGAFLYTHQPDVDAFSANARLASITQLFYNINFLHDWFYDSGFDESWGNAQKSNYGRGGLGLDDIKAQAQDFQSFNNANMLTPADGARPRMRMYNFPNLANTLDVQAPAGIADKQRIGVSQTGLRNFDINADIVIATFTAGPSTCTVTNAAALAGKIAMFDFDNTDGTGCSFSTRITRIHATGAAASLMVYTSGAPTLVANITGINATHTKPIGVISWNSAAPIKTQLAGANAVTARLLRLADRDGALDNQIVAHEWGHYLSGRLIANGNGLNNQQGGGMGEGWGDFLAMLLTVRADDTATPSNATWGGAYALATYATGGVPYNGAANHGYYLGIRRTPYSTDMTNYNALTFKHISDAEALPSGPPIASGGLNSEVHNTGEVWTTMLWECYTALLRDTQGAAPRLSFSEAQLRMKNYLVAGLKMTPASPTFLEARDALLVAAFTYDYQDGLLFAQAFAKRGAGLNAVAPDRFSTNNAGVVESFEAGGALTFLAATLDDSLDNCDGDGYLDNTEEGLLKVTLRNAGFQNLLNTTATVSSDNAHVTFPAGATINFAPTQPGETVTASVAVKVAGATGIETSDFTITFQDTGSPAVAPASAHLFEYVNTDESGSVSGTDNVEPRQTSWAVTNNSSLSTLPSARWHREGGSSGIDHFWFVADPGAASEQFLTSPVMTVDGSGSFNVQFDHSWGFEFDAGSNYDGGVVEMSVNGGAWTDIGTAAYNGTLVNYSGNLNPLKTRKAFTKSSGTVHTSLTQAVAPGSTVQFRFRFGSDNASGADGWRVDNIAFTGVVETPFRVLNPETDVCHVTPPTSGVAIVFSPDALPAAAVGSPYTVTITPSGGTAPYSLNVTPVILPAGLASSVVAGSVQISGTPEHVGTSLVKVTATDNGSNQGSRTYTLTIDKGSSTTTVNVADAAYDGNPHGGTASVTGSGGLSQSLTVTYAGRNGTAYGPSTTAPTDAGDYTASASFAGDSDHSSSSGSADFQITKAAQTINFSPLSDKTFGDAPFTVSATGGISGNAVTFAATGSCTSGGTNGATITITGAGSCTVTASQAGNSNYNAASDAQQSFNVGKAGSTTTVTVSNAVYDGTPHGATAAVTGFGGLNQSIAVLTYAGRNATAYGPLTTAPTGTGDYTASASFAGDSDHSSSSGSADFQITKAGQTITFGTLAGKTFGDADFSVSATATSGLAVSFTASGKCAVLGSTVHLTGVGTCTVTASQAGDANRSGAPSVEQSFQIANGATAVAVASSANPSDAGQSVTFTATVTAAAGTPTGTVTFKDGATTLGTGTLNAAGVATLTTSSLATGAHTISAEYGGDTDHLAGAGTLSGGQTVKATLTLAIGDVTLSEGDSGTKEAVFAVTLSAASSLSVTASFATSDGTTAAPGDYQAASGSLTFAPGETLKTITVMVKGDASSESDETFFVTLSGPVNAALGGTGKGTATIVDDDAAGGRLHFSVAEYGVAEGAGSVRITVVRDGDTSRAASVDYVTDDGSVPSVFVPCSATTGAALRRCDFTAAAGRLEFAAGETSKTFDVLVSDDTYAEGDETLHLVLKNAGGGAVLGTPAPATLTITDDDIVSSGNPLDGAEAFVRAHYHDFLNREPDTAGLQFWTNEINSCGPNPACIEAKRVNVSGAFFHSIEFQNTGYLVYRANVASFGPTRVGGVVPVTSEEFLPDVSQMGQGVVVGAEGWGAKLEANKQAYFKEFVSRAAFTAAFPSTLTPAQFVDALNANADNALSQSERDVLVAELTTNNNGDGRASVLQKVADDADLKAAHSNRAFVLMQYFGYLRRDPNAAPDTNFDGYSFWLSKLNEYDGNYVNAEMVKAFISSDEYRKRFGQ